MTDSQTVPTVTVETLPVITHQEARVITTELMAQLYGTDAVNLRMNFSNNAARFADGKHYFKLEGAPLREFKKLHCVNDIYSVKISPKTRNLMLWTERGAARHAKMLDTDEAWAVFERLEDAYFGAAGDSIKPATLIPSEQQTLSEVVHARCAELNPAIQGKAIAEIWTRVQRKFRVTRYSQLPRTALTAAILYVTTLEIRIANKALPASAAGQTSLEGLTISPQAREAPLPEVAAAFIPSGTRFLARHTGTGWVMTEVPPEAFVCTAEELARLVGTGDYPRKLLPSLIQAAAGRLSD
ncbi:MAG: ORF6N domain-containing protein [Chromatiaceae bacterium]